MMTQAYNLSRKQGDLELKASPGYVIIKPCIQVKLKTVFVILKFFPLENLLINNFYLI